MGELSKVPGERHLLPVGEVLALEDEHPVGVPSVLDLPEGRVVQAREVDARHPGTQGRACDGLDLERRRHSSPLVSPPIWRSYFAWKTLRTDRLVLTLRQGGRA